MRSEAGEHNLRLPPGPTVDDEEVRGKFRRRELRFTYLQGQTREQYLFCA